MAPHDTLAILRVHFTDKCACTINGICVFVWTGENDLQTLGVDQNVFENREKSCVLKRKRIQKLKLLLRGRASVLVTLLHRVCWIWFRSLFKLKFYWNKFRIRTCVEPVNKQHCRKMMRKKIWRAELARLFLLSYFLFYTALCVP